jgi:cyclopropane-fatty-acyl-phospholipid synthase
VARIFGEAQELTPGRLAKTMITHPFCAVLTMPRILWQAAKLHWQRRLSVYEKPVPNSAMTVRPVPPSCIDRIGMKMTIKFLARLPQGELHLSTPGGEHYHFGRPGAEPSLQLTVKEYRFFRRVMVAGDIGFGEAFTDGDWTTSDLPGLLTLLAANEAVMDDRSITTAAIGRLVNYLRHLQRPNTIKGSARNIRQHYDLSNAFFATFLDPSMTYSCALFTRAEESLEQAQRTKLRTIIKKARITAEDHVLEIGCGWGSFALEAVRQTGCRVTGITVSQEQLELARQRVREAGLEDRIEILLCDYRHIEGQYSKVVSIEMLEAVGHAGLGPFFAACERALKPGGRAVIQVITIPDRKYSTYRYSSDWIRKHIFPGGHLPSIGAISRAMAGSSTLHLNELEQYGADYAKTLACWRQALLSKAPEILALGYDETSLRKWEYYFAYCQAGFAAEIIDLAQLVLTKPTHS